MFDKKAKENSKIPSWRLELSQFSYDICRKPEANHVVPDALPRICSVATTKQINNLHRQLGHPGYAQFYHFIQSRNLPRTSQETKEVCEKCQTCAEVKPRFFKLQTRHFIKATNSFERLSVDFKGPVKGRYNREQVQSLSIRFSMHKYNG